MNRRYRLRSILAVVALTSCLGTLAISAPIDEYGRDQLRTIVQQLCVPHWLAAHDPGPCVSVNLVNDGAGAEGVAVLADRKGGAHFLLIPTKSIRGIESPEVQALGAENYFDAAWETRSVLATVTGYSLPSTVVAMAVNHVHARSQDQLHIHLSCLGTNTYEALRTGAEQIGETWAPIVIGGLRYQAMRIMGQRLGTANPFALLADRLPGAKEAMGEFTLLVAGTDFNDGPGFVLLAGTAVPGAERLLDSSCAAAPRPAG